MLHLSAAPPSWASSPAPTNPNQSSIAGAAQLSVHDLTVVGTVWPLTDAQVPAHIQLGAEQLTAQYHSPATLQSLHASSCSATYDGVTESITWRFGEDKEAGFVHKGQPGCHKSGMCKQYLFISL